MSPIKRQWYPLAGPAPSASEATRSAQPIDPLAGPKLALAGRVVTMDDAFTVIADGVVYVEHGAIVAVQERSQAPPEGFAQLSPLATRGTIYPGLIELHNHLAFNALPRWSPVPKRFEHRGQWTEHPDYRKLISGPMTVVGKYRDSAGKPALIAPLVRYVECKCLLGGVTTSQGIKLNSNAGIQRYFRGILRNVEQTDDPALPEAQARIDDVDAGSAHKFMARLNKEQSCFLLHLSEGITPPDSEDSVARRHFLALEVARNKWAINEKLAAIHAAGLLDEDFAVLGQHHGTMVWSPLSNLLLYGATAHMEATRHAQVRIGLGSDWSPSGSKNLLGELKVAWLYSQHLLAGFFSARDLVAMATREAAAILKWDKALGAIEAGKRADILVIAGKDGDPYEALIRAKETSISLVMINGVARYGTPAVMAALGSKGETLRVGGRTRCLYLQQDSADPDVAAVSLCEARTALRKAFRRLPQLARELETATAAPRSALDAPEPLAWSLALDEIQDSGLDLRPRLPYSGPGDFTGPERVSLRAGAAPLSEILQPIELDPLTVADDPSFLSDIAAQPNLPEAIRSGLAELY